MNGLGALRRLQAWKEGRPLPRGETMHLSLAAPGDVLVVAFVRMGGESAPWGIAWGCPGEAPTIRSVPEPRQRDSVAAMVADFAPVLLRHVFHPGHSDVAITSAKDERPLRQVWLPNSSHAEMLHHLAYAYTFAKKGDPVRIEMLNALGRAAGHLFREFNRPGNVVVMAASEALRESFVFPAEDVRQGHLGFLLAWLDTPGSRELRLAAAAAAERRSISTSLDPALERDELDSRVEAGNAREIASILEAELRHRFDLTVAAFEKLRSDERRQNGGIGRMTVSAWAAHWHDYLRVEREIIDRPGERVYVPSPETDTHAAAAADRYFTQQAQEQMRLSLLLEDDLEMQAEAIAAGQAIHGIIRAVRDERTGRAGKPVWEVEVDGEAPTTLRRGQLVFVAGLRGRKGSIRAFELRDGRTYFVVDITGLKTVPRVNTAGILPASDPRHEGVRVVLLPAHAEGIQEIKRKKLFEKDTPGSWLTDRRPSRRGLPADVVGPTDGPGDPS